METMHSIEPRQCPFCGEHPSFEGNGRNWKDESRYVEMKLVCCVEMTETIGWFLAKDMIASQIESELKEKLTTRWNNRIQVD